MNCREIEQLLTEDLYGALADKEVRGHLKDCSSCERLGRELEQIQILKDSLSSRTAAPPDLPVRVARGFSRARLQRMLLLAAAPLLAICAVAVAERYLNMPVDHSASSVGPIPSERIHRSWEAWEEVGAGWESRLQLERPLSRPPQYLEVILSDPAEGQFIVQFPSTIEVRRSDPGREYLAYVSH